MLAAVRTGDEEADAVEEAVEAVQRDESGDTEERGGGHVVAGDGDAVLDAGDRASGGVEVIGVLGLATHAHGDEQRDPDEAHEQADREGTLGVGDDGGQGVQLRLPR